MIVDLLRDGTIVRTVISFAIVLVFAILVLNGADIPDLFQVLIGAVIGYYFATQTVSRAQTVVSKRTTQESEKN